jgi:hypothetical protein
MFISLIAQRNAVLADLGHRAASEGCFDEAISLFDAAINFAREHSLSGGAPLADSVAIAVQPNLLLCRGSVQAAVGRLSDAFDDFFAAMMVERFRAQLLAETEGDPLPPLSLGRETRHELLPYPWFDEDDVDERCESQSTLASSVLSSSRFSVSSTVATVVVPPSLIGVSALTRLKLALIHEAIGVMSLNEHRYFLPSLLTCMFAILTRLRALPCHPVVLRALTTPTSPPLSLTFLLPSFLKFLLSYFLATTHLRFNIFRPVLRCWSGFARSLRELNLRFTASPRRSAQSTQAWLTRRGVRGGCSECS